MLKHDFAIENQEDEDLRCPICNYYFSNSNKPYLLNCSHNLCIKCIDSIIGKKMFNCPICRKNFNQEDRKNFQVNISFLNLVIKILKTKVIYCGKCAQIFNWTDHHSICDQSCFKETNEILEEIKTLAEECHLIVTNLDRYRNVLDKSKRLIYNDTNELLKAINLKFMNDFQKTIDNFFSNVPAVEYNTYIKTILKFLELCKPLGLENGALNHFYSNNQDNSKVEKIMKPNYFTHFHDDTNVTPKGNKKAGLIDNNDFFDRKVTSANYSTNHLHTLSRFTPVRIRRMGDFVNKTDDNISDNNLKVRDLGQLLNPKKKKLLLNPLSELESDNDNLNNSEDISHLNSEMEMSEEVSDKGKAGINKPKNTSTKKSKPASVVPEDEPVSIEDDEEESVINYNYNFNLNDFIESEPNNLPNSPNRNKQKIIVRNDKVEIVKNAEIANKKDLENLNTGNNININENININLNNESKINNMNINFNMSNTTHNNIISVNQSDNIPHSNQTARTTYEMQIEALSKLQKARFLENSKDKPENKLTTSRDNFTSLKLATPRSQVMMEDVKLNQQESVNKLISNYNKTKEITQKILHYYQQVEFTSTIMRNQISSNYNNLSDNITKTLHSLYDNITVSDFAPTNKRHLVNLMDNGKKIWLFDSKKMKCEIKEFDNLRTKLNYSMGIEFDDNDLIFITGGKMNSSTNLFSSDNGDSSYTNTFTIVRWSNKMIEVQGQMPRKRAYHSTLFFNKNLYIIGGAMSESMKIKECERYNIIDKRWEMLPGMNSTRCNPSLCMYNGVYLYAFRGWNSNDTHLDTIEYLNTEKIGSGWVLIKPEDPGMSWLAASNSTAVVLSKDKILICGGSINFQNPKLIAHTFIYDVVKKTVFRGKDLLRPAAFNTCGTFYDNTAIAIDFKNEGSKPFGVHVFDTENRLWKFNQS